MPLILGIVRATVYQTFLCYFTAHEHLTSVSMSLWLIEKLEHGDQALGYRNTNIVFGIMVFLIMLICVASIREIKKQALSKILDIW